MSTLPYPSDPFDRYDAAAELAEHAALPEKTLENTPVATLIRWILNRQPGGRAGRKSSAPTTGAIPLDELRAELRRREAMP